MSIPIAIPVSAQVIPTVNRFTATFNAPTINRYDFGIAANTDQLILAMENRSIYIIEQVAFSMDIAEADFENSINIVPQIRFTRAVPATQIFQAPLPFANYFDGLNTYMFFSGVGGNDVLQGTFTGILNQVPATVGKLTITANVQLQIYKINDQQWIAKFLDRKNDLGAGLNLRGKRDPRGW